MFLTGQPQPNLVLLKADIGEIEQGVGVELETIRELLLKVKRGEKEGKN